MCGIFGYIGSKDASKVVIEGLKRLEYRGYDSWGIAVLENGTLRISKKVGPISDVTDFEIPLSHISIGHTRWATHGGVSELNAHPHFSSDKSFSLAQNGIVENYMKLKDTLVKKGYKFNTQTDTEVIVRLIEDKLKSTSNLKEAVRSAFSELTGRNTIILLTNEGTILAARNGSPLVIGFNPKTEEIFFGSDTLSFAPLATEVVVVNNGQLVLCKDNTISIFDLKTNIKIPVKRELIEIKSSKVDKEEYDHFMIKEIHDSGYVVRQIIDQDKNPYLEFGKVLNKARHVYTIGSGTAGIAAAQTAYYLRSIAKIEAISLVGADAFEYIDLMTNDDIIIAPSQSGETADVLEVLELLKKKGVQIASYVNMQGSMITKMSDFKFMSQAGPEICVISTKVFTSQIAWGYLIAKSAANDYEDGIEQLSNLSKLVDEFLNSEVNHKKIKKLATILKNKKDIFLLGKSQNFQIIREGMVKLIEATYKHAHAIPAGDLKHYAITLIEEGVPVIVTLSNDQARTDVVNAVNEVKTRGAYAIAIGPDLGKFDFSIEVPDSGETSAILNVIPLQLLAYYMTLELGNNVDKPRNLAKSVTVK